MNDTPDVDAAELEAFIQSLKHAHSLAGSVMNALQAAELPANVDMMFALMYVAALIADQLRRSKDDEHALKAFTDAARAIYSMHMETKKKQEQPANPEKP